MQADQNQNRAFNPFSEISKEMINSVGYMEYFEICEITPKIVPQLYEILDESHCVLYLRNMLTTFRQSSKTKQRPRRSNYVIKKKKKEKSHPTGARHGNTERQRIYHAAQIFFLKRRRKKKYESILDRFLSSPRCRQSQIDIVRSRERRAH